MKVCSPALHNQAIDHTTSDKRNPYPTTSIASLEDDTFLKPTRRTYPTSWLSVLTPAATGRAIPILLSRLEQGTTSASECGSKPSRLKSKDSHTRMAQLALRPKNKIQGLNLFHKQASRRASTVSIIVLAMAVHSPLGYAAAIEVQERPLGAFPESTRWGSPVREQMHPFAQQRLCKRVRRPPLHAKMRVAFFHGAPNWH